MRVERPGRFATNRADSSIFFCTKDGRVLAIRDKNGVYIDRNKLLTASAP